VEFIAEAPGVTIGPIFPPILLMCCPISYLYEVAEAEGLHDFAKKADRFFVVERVVEGHIFHPTLNRQQSE
jgi:hypothetical protein